MSPISGYISPAVAILLGLLIGPLFLAGEKLMSKKWFSDPIGLFPTHLLAGLFGFLMIAFFTQRSFSTASGAANLPNGLFFGGGMLALRQLEVDLIAVAAVATFVFVLSYVTLWSIGKLMNGITTDYAKEFGKVTAIEHNFEPVGVNMLTGNAKK